MPNPILAANANSSYPAKVSSFALPAVNPLGNDLVLYAVVSTSQPACPIVPPAGWTMILIRTAGGETLGVYRKEVPAASGPYSDTFTFTGGPAYVGMLQFAFRSAGGAYPGNSDWNSDTYGCGSSSPVSIALPSSPTAANLILGIASFNGCGGPYSGARTWAFTDGGWTEVFDDSSIGGAVGLALAYRVADGTPGEDTVAADFQSTRSEEQTVLIVEDVLLEDPTPTGAVAWDAYAAADPNGAVLATIQDDSDPLEGATERSVRVALNEPGQGSFKINRYSSVALEAVLARGNLVKCRFPWRDDYDFGFILEKGDFTLAARTEKAGEEFGFGGRGLLAYLDRAIMDAVAYTTGLDTEDRFVEVWHTNKAPKPVGVAFVPTDSAYVYVIGEQSRRIYKIRQSDRALVKTGPVLWAGTDHYASGLSADPSDASILWALEAPWLSGSGSNTRIHKVDRATLAVLATYSLGAATHLTDIRASTATLWTTNYATDKIEKRSKAAPATLVASYTVTYGGNAQVNPNGVAISDNGTGTEIAMWFGGSSSGGVKRALVADLTDPTTVTRTINTSDIASFGGDWSSEGGDTFFYMVSHTLGLTWKYQLTASLPHDPRDGTWRLDEGKPGAILWRVIQEAQAAGRPQQPIPDLTYDFTEALDSDGATWDDHDGTLEFDAKVTDSVLAVALRLLPYGLIEQMTPRLKLGAFNASSYGTNRTSATFATGKVRFEKGVNIIPELGRQERERPLHSHMLATGKGSLYARAIEADLGYVREGGITTDLADTTALEGTAEATLADERVKSERIRLAVPIGDDQAAGKYLPFTHYNVGDLVTLHSGSGEHDFTNEAFVLYAFTLEESKAGRWERALVELGSATLADAPGSGGSGAGGGSSSGSGTGTSGGGPTGMSALTVEGLDDTGATLTSAIGQTIRVIGAQVYQAGVGVIGMVIDATTRLLGLSDVDAEDIADGQVLAFDEASGTFIPADLPTGGGTIGAAGEGAYTEEIQHAQARRFLMQNGEFRNPLIVGDGVFTPGATSTIRDVTGDPDYLSWVGAGRPRLRDGRPFIVYHRGNGHDLDNTGNVMGLIGVEAADGSIDWTAAGGEFTVYDHATLNATPGGLCVLHDGRVLVSVMRFNVAVANTGEAGLVYADPADDGTLTFSAWIPLTNGFTQEAYAAGPPVELPDGSVIVSIEGTNTGTAAINRSSHSVLSTDRGETWGGEVTIRNYATDARPYYESCFLLVDHAGVDELWIFHRTSDAPGTIYLQKSSDLGATSGGWAAPVAAFDGYARPAATQRWTGTVVVPVRRNADASVVLFSSTDYGDSWTETVIATGMYEMEYAVWLDLLTGDGAVIYGSQPTSSTGNSDVKMTGVSEGLVDVRDALSVTAADVSIADLDGHFTGTDVEAALAELAEEVGSATTYRAVVMMPGITHPPNPVETPDGDSWVYGLVSAP